MYVPISNTTIGGIRAVINDLSRAELNSLPDVEAIANKIADDSTFRHILVEGMRVFHGVTPEEAAAVARITFKAGFRCDIVVEQALLAAVVPSITSDARVTVSGHMNFPCWMAPTVSRYDAYRHPSGISISELHEFKDSLVTGIALRHDARARWNTVEQSVLKVLNASRSLNEAVKAAPHILPYIPENLREKLEEKRGRDKRDTSDLDKAVAGLDAETLTTAAVLGRMAKAGSGPVHG